jgi:hypothetical protein
MRKALRNFFPLLLVAGLIAVGGCASTKKATQAKPASFWPPYPDEPRVQFLTSFKSSTDVQPQKSGLDQLVYGKEIEQSQGIVKPYGIDMWNGRIYVCDLRGSCVTALDVRNHKTLILGRGGATPLQDPTDIAIAPDGTKYVADLSRGLVYVFDAQERQIATFGHKDLRPVGVAVFDNELYVCDFKAQRVEVLDRRNGALIRTVGSAGQGDGQFIRPLGIAVDAQGFLYVTDVLKCQMQKFDRAGKLVTTFGVASANAGGFVRPKHIDVDRDGTIYVVDAAFQNVQLFDQQGHVFTFFGSAGGHPGSMYLPAGISIHDGDLDVFAKYVHPAFEPQRLILVTNQFGDNKVSVYALGHLKAGKTVADISNTQGIVPSGTGTTLAGPGSPLPSSTMPSLIPSDITGTSAAAVPAGHPAPATRPVFSPLAPVAPSAAAPK